MSRRCAKRPTIEGEVRSIRRRIYAQWDVLLAFPGYNTRAWHLVDVAKGCDFDVEEQWVAERLESLRSRLVLMGQTTMLPLPYVSGAKTVKQAIFEEYGL